MSLASLVLALSYLVPGCGDAWAPAPPPDASWPTNAADAYSAIEASVGDPALRHRLRVESPNDLDDEARKLLRAQQATIEQLLTAVQIESCDYALAPHQVLTNELPFVPGHRQLNALLVADGVRQAVNGHERAAAERFVAALRMGQHLDDFTHTRLVATSYLARVCDAAQAVLDSGHFESTKARAMLRTELEQLDASDPFGLIASFKPQGEMVRDALSGASPPGLRNRDPELAALWKDAGAEGRRLAGDEYVRIMSSLGQVSWGSADAQRQIDSIRAGIKSPLVSHLLPPLDLIQGLTPPPQVKVRETIDRLSEP